MNKYLDQFRTNMKGVKPFSGETALLLSLFSWLVYLLIQEPAVKQLISIAGWIFLIIGTDWVLYKKNLTVPILDLELPYGPWITGALISAALLSNGIILDIPTAFVVWPLFSGVIAAIPTVLKTGPQIKEFPKDYKPFELQRLVLLTLISLLLSSWLQFHFLLNGLIDQYPSILADPNIGRSAFVVRVNPPTRSKGADILESAENIIRNELRRGELRGRSWRDSQRFLSNIQATDSPIRSSAIAPIVANTVFSQTPAFRESKFWLYDSQFYPSNTDNSPGSQSPWYGSILLQAIWQGPSARPGGYRIERNCLIPREPPVQQIRGLERPREQSFFLLECQEIRSPQEPDVNLNRVVEEPLGDRINDFFRR
ncbi:MAG: DUF5357 domain-containing protein [Oculatellaceae cyanobacterium Prado106]|nr:DUF5357 domain-containing protein [Oculatellaceae cyanobacterium Prado106]